MAFNIPNGSLGRFLSGINGSRSIDCLPQGLHPCKALGASFLHIVDRNARLRSDIVLRFLDDIHLLADDNEAIQADMVIIQHLLGEKGLSLNSVKTKHMEENYDIERRIDDIKIKLLRIRRELIEVSGEVEEMEVREYEQLSDEQTEYLLSLLRDPEIEEADAELVLRLLTERGDEVLDSMASIWPRYPALSKAVYAHITRTWHEDADVLAMARAFLANAPNATEYQLFWLAKILHDIVGRSGMFGEVLLEVHDHPHATQLVRAKVLEIADDRFGLTELREETLRNASSGWEPWAAAIGCRVQTKQSRNKLIQHFGKISPMNGLIAAVAAKLPQCARDEPEDLGF